MYKGLPLYYADINDEVAGVQIMSIVNRPAVETVFVRFAEEGTPAMFAANDEKQVVSGVVLIPDFPIFRRDTARGEYYVAFKADAIERIAQKFFTAEGATSAISLNHSDPASQCVIFESYLIDHARGIVPAEFADHPDGTWIISLKINNPTLWADIKSGKYKGFSIEGFLDYRLANDSKSPNNTKMGKVMKGLKALFEQVFAKMGKVDTKEGALYWNNDQMLRVGDEVWIRNVEDDGEPDYDKAPAGEYHADDGRVIVVNDEGIVSEIKQGGPPDVRETKAAADDGRVIVVNDEGIVSEIKQGGPPDVRETKAAADDVPADKPADAPTDDKPERKDNDERINNLEKAIADLIKAIDEERNARAALEANIRDIKERIAKVELSPADKPADAPKPTETDLAEQRRAALAALREKNIKQ